MTELKPCPFCGNEAEINEFYPSKFAIGCITQGCCAYWSSTPMFDTEMEAIDAWNTRYERTCHMDRRPATIAGSIGYLTCSFCDCGFDYTEEPFNCMNCGAKVVDE